jgi:hypothetical protein
MTGMTREQLLALPVTVDLQTAGRAWGLSRSRVYDAHARNALPFPVVVVSGRLKVTRAALLKSLDIDEAEPATGPAAVTAASVQETPDDTDGATLRAV